MMKKNIVTILTKEVLLAKSENCPGLGCNTEKMIVQVASINDEGAHASVLEENIKSIEADGAKALHATMKITIELIPIGDKE